MKNVYKDYEIDNDTAEGAESVEEKESLTQFKDLKKQESKKRRVEYDEHGNVRKDRSFNFVKILGMIVVMVVVYVYAYHSCGADILTAFQS